MILRRAIAICAGWLQGASLDAAGSGGGKTGLQDCVRQRNVLATDIWHGEAAVAGDYENRKAVGVRVNRQRVVTGHNSVATA